MEFSQKKHFSFADLVALVHFLRSPQGCSWDQEQTHESIRRHFIEEAYEVCEGIDKNDNDLLCEELGDMLFQVLFHTDIAEGENAFHLTDVFDGICKKMIRRHPHL
ncbi:MAG: nucleoside triphosphate pyrophosphohydrolase, partial [Clostridia bacterium]|nr:nucleoside triphosphate pyrophosphohydrolase [Clostridia bacterium]